MDYHICCAMINFNFKPCVPDKKYNIARRLKKKCLKTMNKLYLFLI